LASKTALKIMKESGNSPEKHNKVVDTENFCFATNKKIITLETDIKKIEG